MSDLRVKILEAALPDIPFDGFSDAVLVKAGETLGLSKEDVASAFPEGAQSLVEAFSDWADAKMIEAVKAAPAGAKIRERITRAIAARLEAMSAHKLAAKRAAAFLALPQNAPLGMKLLYRTVDAMWVAAGDESTDISFYSKRGILAGVYGATLLHWLADDSEGHASTWAFLDARIANVMDFEKWKAEAKKYTGKLPDPFEILGSIKAALRPKW